MNQALPATHAAAVEQKSVSNLRKRVISAIRLLVAWIFGAFLCMHPITALLVVGWTYRFVQKDVIRRWQKRMDEPENQSRIPSWILSDRFKVDLQEKRFLRAFLGGLWSNLVIGVKACFNAFLVTAPAGAFLTFAWYAGWDNSFNKGYEQAWVGPTMGFLGLACLVVVMGPLTIAMARQAVTGDARAFWRWKTIRRILWRHPIRAAFLAAAYAILGFGTILHAFSLLGAYSENPQLAAAPVEEVKGFLWKMNFLWSLLLLPAFVFLKWFAGRIYGRGRFEERASGEEHHDLAGAEIALADLRPPPGEVGKKVGRTGHLWKWAIKGAVLLFIWIPFGVQLIVAEFFVHEPLVRFNRHPLVQIPWVHVVPTHLDEE